MPPPTRPSNCAGGGAAASPTTPEFPTSVRTRPTRSWAASEGAGDRSFIWNGSGFPLAAFRFRALGGQPGGVESARSSWLREVRPSLAKTLLRWYSTVRALMKRRVPISGFVSPSCASRAIWSSWAVSSSWLAALRVRRKFEARHAAASHPISVTNSRPIRRASERSRFSTRSPLRAANSPGSRNARRCRSTASEVSGSTPGMAADTT